WPQYFTKILTMIAAGTTPDVMDVATEGVQLFAGKGLSQPIDDYVKQDQAAIQEYFSDVHPVLVEAMMYQGHLYQLPHDWNSRYVYLNTKLFQDAKVAFPASDWDKDAFYKTTQSLTKQGGGPPYGFGWENRLMGGWLHWVVMNGSNLLSEDHWPGGDWLWNTFYKDDPTAKGHKGGWHWGEPTANAAANVEALDFLVQMAKENLTPAVQVGGGSLLEGFFTSNKLAMTPGGGFWAGGLHQAGMKPDAFDIQVFPKWKTQRNVFGTAGLALMQKAKDKDLAWEYMKYRIRKDVIGVILADNSSTPPRRSMMTAERYAPTGPKNWQEYYAAIEKFPSLPLPTPPWYQELNTIVTKYTSLIMTFSQSPKDGLENMQKDLDAAYKTFQSGG
ncbi:MAG TPA: extracellular solute-binding protein, partial [Chloroflexota bacterium]|nr:extracellular solute-binding protein [Chloroflexota bacterium]